MSGTTVEFRSEPGNKGEGDERIYWRTVSGIEKGPWETVKMQDIGKGVVLLAENEDRLAKHNPHWYRKGEKILDYLRDCRRYGQRSADVRHKLEQPSFDWLSDGGNSEQDDDV